MKKRILTVLVTAALFLSAFTGCSSDTAGSSSQAGSQPSEPSIAADTVTTTGYPQAEIKLIVTAAAGGGTDAVARAVSVPLEQKLGKPIVVINQGSAGGLVGMGEIAGAAADGYTLGVFSNTDIANFVYGPDEVEFAIDDFTYIAGLNSTGDILILRKDSPYANLDEFVAAAKAAPGSMTIGLPSAIQFLSLDLVNGAFEMDTTGVVYDGGNKVLADLIGGHVDAGILSAKFAPQCEENDMAVLGLLLDERLETIPDVPTFGELGYDISNAAVRMLVGPKGMPQEVIDLLTQELAAEYEGSVKENLLAIDESPLLRNYEEINAFLEKDFAMRKSLLEG